MSLLECWYTGVLEGSSDIGWHYKILMSLAMSVDMTGFIHVLVTLELYFLWTFIKNSVNILKIKKVKKPMSLMSLICAGMLIYRRLWA